MNDPWSLKYKNISVWSYFTFYFSENRELPYKVNKNNLSKSIFHSVFFLFVFLTLRFRKTKNVTCLISRKDVNDFINSYLKGKARIQFIRPEMEMGNTLFIELIWLVFRRFAYIFDRKGYKCLIKDIKCYGIDDREAITKSKIIIGDYFYNHFIAYFLKGKKVFYTNCIVPKIEKYMGLSNSVEVQHGIIYDGHPDYSKIPESCLKDSLLVWNKSWKDKLQNEVLYGGVIIDADYMTGFYDRVLNSATGEILVYTTVNDEYQYLINDANEDSLYVQCHPRDKNIYKESVKKINDANPINFDKVYIHDSTLILSLVTCGCFFYYLKTVDESEEEIIARLMSKYSVKIGENYNIVNRIEI